MKCYLCKQDLSWNNDESYDDYEMEGEGIVTILSCLNEECDVDIVEVYQTFKDVTL
jgi:hypothetical protein